MVIDVAAEVLHNTRLSTGYNVLGLAAPDIARQARPGQFVMLRPQTGLDPMLRRPFSIFEVLRDGAGAVVGLSILNKRVGIGTTLLYDASPGDRVGVLGPLGQPFVPVAPPEHAWMVAGGVGLAPFATLAEALAEQGTPMTLFYGGRSASDLYYLSFFEGLGARLVLTTDDGTHGEAGRVTAPLDRALAALKTDRALTARETDRALTAREAEHAVTIYACGPTPMMRAVARLGDRAGCPVFVSLEPVMGCGLGGCYSCVVPVREAAGHHFVRCCLEGPVFDAARLDWAALSSVGH
jgi:dihydroorotate dehydrogenase electron transfer subunit